MSAAHERQLMDDPSAGVGDIGGMGGIPNPGNSADAYKRKPFANREDIHPALRQYDNVVKVRGDESS